MCKILSSFSRIFEQQGHVAAEFVNVKLPPAKLQMFDLHSGPWSLLVEEASVNVGPSWMTPQRRLADLDHKDGSKLRHGESKREREREKDKTKHHSNKQL